MFKVRANIFLNGALLIRVFAICDSRVRKKNVDKIKD